MVFNGNDVQFNENMLHVDVTHYFRYFFLDLQCYKNQILDLFNWVVYLAIGRVFNLRLIQSGAFNLNLLQNPLYMCINGTF
jgi:hypothetical protein